MERSYNCFFNFTFANTWTARKKTLYYVEEPKTEKARATSEREKKETTN
jgi:hypothetical protein